jgi:Domain of unknown function (DUF4384)
MRVLIVAATLGAIGLPVYAQTSDLSARDMFYSSADMLGKAPNGARPKPRPANVPSTGTTKISVSSNVLGLRYSILRRDAGQFVEVPPNTIFRAGDRIRLSLMANDKGYLYIVQQGSSGTWSPLFPTAEINSGHNLVEAGQNYVIPSGKGESFVMDEHAGEESVFILLTREPEPNLDKLVIALKQSNGANSSAAIQDALIAKIRDQVQPRDLVFTKMDDPAPDKEKAVYVVNAGASSNPDSRVVVDVKLNHR